ncbi:hypothetical protein GCM10008927_15220 [Amylibacter ulvae]|uniref:DUF2269 family protein n=1 Tax=Paramylibacter ulvae TaxID=1651968 RepID=A0ABQ3D4N1_9RHOB|nr:hypothetical protein GCM10008927_15220 [Amylibacter ulvae]
MDIPQAAIDLLRIAHLFCFAAGMGTALYFDFRALGAISRPSTTEDIAQLEHIHNWIAVAFLGLWITGIALVYVRTGFQISAFSPKLWLKLGLMTLMTLNTKIIAAFIMPLMRNNVHRALSDLPLMRYVAASQAAILSMFCWSSGVFLGASVVLKTAPWDVLIPLFVGWFILLTVAGQCVAILAYKLATRDARNIANTAAP